MATPETDDLAANLSLSIDRINGQRSAGDALDAKALGAPALDAAGIDTLVAVSLYLPDVAWPRDGDVGPDPDAFFRRWGGEPAVGFRLQMPADLLYSIAVDDHAAKAKGRRSGGIRPAHSRSPGGRRSGAPAPSLD